MGKNKKTVTRRKQPRSHVTALTAIFAMTLGLGTTVIGPRSAATAVFTMMGAPTTAGSPSMPGMGVPSGITPLGVPGIPSGPMMPPPGTAPSQAPTALPQMPPSMTPPPPPPPMPSDSTVDIPPMQQPSEPSQISIPYATPSQSIVVPSAPASGPDASVPQDRPTQRDEPPSGQVPTSDETPTTEPNEPAAPAPDVSTDVQTEQHAAAPAISFSDVPDSHPYKQSIDEAVRQGIVKGNSDGKTFSPDDPINRAAFAKIITNDAKESDRERCRSLPSKFKDISKQDWYYEYACLAEEMELMSGKGNSGIFAGSEPLNLAEIAKIVSKKYNLPVEESAGSEWFSKYIDALENVDAIPSEMSVPSAVITRGQAINITVIVIKVSQGLMGPDGKPTTVEHSQLMMPAAPVFAPSEPPLTAPKKDPQTFLPLPPLPDMGQSGGGAR